MLARVPWTPPLIAKAKPRRINADRRKHILSRTVLILKQGEPTRFAFEAACRHGIRRGLCLEGVPWAEADAVAVEIVTAALHQIGARRPTWQQGQPEWAQDGFAPIERTRCVRCHKPLPKGHFKYCSSNCGDAHYQHVARLREAEEGKALDMAVRSIAGLRKG